MPNIDLVLAALGSLTAQSVRTGESFDFFATPYGFFLRP